MKRFAFYLLKTSSVICKAFSHKLYMKLIVKAHKVKGVNIIGKPAYIDYSTYIDSSGGLTINEGCVISVNTIILTHDWSFLKRYKARHITSCNEQMLINQAFKSVVINEHSFIGAGAIVLPGSKIGKYCLIGTGAVVKGTIDDYSIIIGNPARKIGDVRDPKYKLVE